MDIKQSKNITILSYQPYSVYAPGGSSRILRRMYKNREAQIHSLAVEFQNGERIKGKIHETFVQAFPIRYRWMRWYVRNFMMWLNERVFKIVTEAKIRKAAKSMYFDVVHVINQGPFSTALCKSFFLQNKQLWVSFHDDFSVIKSSFKDANLLWQLADRRLVISKEMGEHYNYVFEKKDYEIITDGIETDEICESSDCLLNADTTHFIIYFAGLLHIDYYPLFQTLAEALDSLVVHHFSFTLQLRGTQKINFLEQRKFKVEYLPFTLDEATLKNELWNAHFLYLPIKFEPAQFAAYSLSTKMIGYLGAPGNILYHGPKESAVYNLLKYYKASINCTSLDMNEMIETLRGFISNTSSISVNAKLLAKEKFDLVTIQNLFWKPQ